MRKSAIPFEDITLLLDKLKENGCVILRNIDYKHHLERGGDIDLLVHDLNRAHHDALDILGPPILFIPRSHIWSSFWQWGHIDFFPRVEYRGAEFLDREEIFKNAIKAGENSAPHPAHEALICWFSNVLWGGYFKERYKQIIISAAYEYPEYFYKSLAVAVGPKFGNRLFSLAKEGTPEVSANWVEKLRIFTWLRSFSRKPWQTISQTISYWDSQILRMSHPPLPVIAFLGMDGCGKTSVIKKIHEEFNDVPFLLGSKVLIKHWRPGILRKGDPNNMSIVTDPHGKPPRNYIFSLAKLVFLLVDWWLGYLFQIRQELSRGQLILFDRHLLDLVVDPRRYRYGGPDWLAKLVSHLIPQPELFIYLDLPAETAIARKPEVELEDARQLRQKYLMLAKNQGEKAHVVNAARPLESVIADVEKIILDHMEARTHGRLKNIKK